MIYLFCGILGGAILSAICAPLFRKEQTLESAIVEETEWDRYGTGRNPKCAQCMAHCGYEPTAVNDAFAHPVKAAWVALRGPRTAGSTVAEASVSLE